MVNYCYFLPFAWASKTGGTGAAQTLFPACLRAKLHAPALPIRYSHFTKEAVDIQRGRANYPRSRSWLETEIAPPWAPESPSAPRMGVCASQRPWWGSQGAPPCVAHGRPSAACVTYRLPFPPFLRNYGHSTRMRGCDRRRGLRGISG